MAATATPDAASELKRLRNVGPAAIADFARLGIYSIAELAQQEPDELYARLCAITARRHDPCVHDVFAATIHEARTGEPIDWWTLSAGRKARQAAGAFVPPADARAPSAPANATCQGETV